ncbi:MAG TPA: DUF222 domain-containing protein [Polyangiales bacterium]|nr:DUF222 domain-containing protein [Polyangiales bacterium]
MDGSSTFNRDSHAVDELLSIEVASGVEPPTIEAMERELSTLAGHMNAANYRFLKVLAEFDRREGYAGTGIHSCAHWVSWRCGVSLIAAREKVRVARALQQLPKISDAMRRGVISYCKVRALTRIACPENEETLLLIAEAGTVSHVERTVQLFRKVERIEELEAANKQHNDRFLQCYVDEQGCVVLKGRLPPEQGAAFMAALRSAADTLGAEDASRESAGAPDAAFDDHGARNADALGLLAETFLVHGATAVAAGDRHLVTVHIDEAVLRDEASDGRCELRSSTTLPPPTVRRLCCDGSLVAIVEDEQGTPLSVGRKTRAIPPKIRRALDARDAGCRYPGCCNTRFVDAHHIIHWADGGETKLDNLVLLCRRHHRFLHEHGYTIAHTGTNEFQFNTPDGRAVDATHVTAPIDAETGYAQLQEDHEELELNIDDDTGDSHWRGESLDYHWVIRSLLNKTLHDMP